MNKRKNKKRILLSLAILVMFSVFTLANFDTSEAARRGVMGCNASGFGSVGSRTPSGAHVPIWDSAVSLNTNILVYKECILDGVSNAFKRAAVSKVLETSLNTINTGMDGGPMFVENLNIHIKNTLDPVAESIYNGKATENIPDQFRSAVRTSLRKYYQQQTNEPSLSLSGSVSQAQYKACINDDIEGCGGLEGYYKFISNPNNNALFSYLSAREYMDNALAAKRESELAELGWGSGFRSAKKAQTITLADGSTVTINKIVTPGYLIAGYASQLIGTGLRQLENADEIDEIIGLLMSNIGTKILKDPNGLAGIKPYLGDVVDEAYSDGRSQLVTLTLNTLNSALQNEATILASLEATANAILATKNSIRNTDLQCLDKVVTEAEQATKNELCISSMGTTTGCGVTVSRVYDHSAVEAFESSRQKISIAGYARGANKISTEYSGGGQTIGRANTTAGGTYNKYTSAGQDLKELQDGIVRPFANETASSTYRTLGDFIFTKTSQNGEPAYKFSYDLPDVTITAISPTSTVANLAYVLDLKKNHTQLEVENNSGTKYQVLADLYGHIGSIKKIIQDLQDAKTTLASEQSNEAINAAEKVLNNARTDQAAFIFAEEMKGKLAVIRALATETTACWTESDGRGCESPRWCTESNINANWRNNYIR